MNVDLELLVGAVSMFLLGNRDAFTSSTEPNIVNLETLEGSCEILILFTVFGIGFLMERQTSSLELRVCTSQGTI